MSKMLTFGVLPSKKAFHAAWKENMGERRYSYTLGRSDAESARFANVPTSGSFSEAVTRDIVRKLRNAFNRGDDNSGNIASSILGTLGFEWV